MSKIALLLPTRERPNQLNRLIQSVRDTADHPEDIIISVYIDDDDKSYDGLAFPVPSKLVSTKGPRLHDGKVNLSVKWNKCWEAVRGEAEYFFHCGDDIVFNSQGWDTEIKKAIDEYPGKIAFVWGDDFSDESQRNEFGTHGFIHKNWAETVGYFVPPYFVSDYNDTFLNEVSRKLNVQRYLHHVKTEHLHHTLGKAPMDKNTEERLKRHEQDRPEEIYNSPWFQAEMEEKREKLQEFINEHR